MQEKKQAILFDKAITSERLRLQLLHIDDLEDVYQYAKDPKVAENTSWYAHQNLEDTQGFIQHVLNRHNALPGTLHLTWAIRVKHQEEAIGTISFVQDSETEGHIDYALARKHWGNGYITEAVRAIVDWAFAQLPLLEKINSGCLSRNVGSVKVLEKAGFQITKRYESQRGEKFDHQVLETTLFSIQRSANESLKQSF